MTTKDAKRQESMALRSSRRSKNLGPKETKIFESENVICQIDSKDLNNHIEGHKQQLNSPKIEKESTSPPNNEPLALTIPQDKSRRVTRSFFISSKKICNQLDPQNDVLTPDDNQISRVSQQPTSKKIVKAVSAQSVSQNGCADLSATVKKPIVKLPQNMVSPYSEVRKSYRRNHRNEVASIPYRKCHDAFEGRIVAIINKIQGGKNCLRDFESLVERIQKISGKDMMNRFIIAGIATIIKLSKEKSIYDLKLIERLQAEEKKLKQRIIQEMDSLEAFESSLPANNQQFIDSKHYKNKLIRKIYKIMKHKRNFRYLGNSELREKAIKDCQKFFGCEINVGSLIKFVKQKTDFHKQ